MLSASICENFICAHLRELFEAQFQEYDFTDKIVAIDNCSDVTISLVNIEEYVDSCQIEYRHWYSIQDECGNVSRCMQTIRYTRNLPDAPTVEIPEDTTVFCTVPDPPVYDGICDQASLELIYEFDTGYEDNNCVVYRYWMLTTCEGNLKIGVQIIEVQCAISGSISSSADKSSADPNSNSDGSLQPSPVMVEQTPFSKVQYELVLYPNPAQNCIIPDLSGADLKLGNTSVHIYDQYGRLLKERVTDEREVEQRIDIADLPDGMYFLQVIEADNRRWSKSFI